jgi:ArsR family transcriptional regulator, arsenate/arsenite/antimonite-responsive transcriptional repressor
MSTSPARTSAAEHSLALDALADPTRREILQVVAAGEDTTVGEIAERVPAVGRTAVSSHLRVLRVAGLVTDRRDGRFRRYSVNARAAAEVMEFLSGLLRISLTDLASAQRGPSSDGRSRHGKRRTR